jgi:hypothetical protein
LVDAVGAVSLLLPLHIYASRYMLGGGML